MIPWLKAGAIGVLAGAALGAWGGYQLRDGQAAKAELKRQQTEQRDTLRRQEAATGAAQTFEEMRDAIRRELLAAMPRVAPALARPVGAGCPAVGDVVLPAGALDRVRSAAGELGDPAADPGRPGPPVQPGASAPGR